MKYVLPIIGVLALLTFGGLAIKFIFFPVHTAQNQVQLMYDASDKVLNADNAIYNYEWFKKQHGDIEASKKQLDNSRKTYASFTASLPESRIEWSFEDKQEDARLRTVVLGIENNLEAQIAEYNARASMATRNIFEDSVLPSFIDALTFIGK